MVWAFLPTSIYAPYLETITGYHLKGPIQLSLKSSLKSGSWAYCQLKLQYNFQSKALSWSLDLTGTAMVIDEMCLKFSSVLWPTSVVSSMILQSAEGGCVHTAWWKLFLDCVNSRTAPENCLGKCNWPRANHARDGCPGMCLGTTEFTGVDVASGATCFE